MRNVMILLAGAAFAAGSAKAADDLKFAPAPPWVVQQTIPLEATTSGQAPVVVLLNDSQIRLESGKVTTFTELALKIGTPEGLEAGNIAFPWQPATDTVTVNKLHIIRDGKTIDVLKAGQTFTIARRETKMEAAMLDGSLTANIQPEGLQVGDIINLEVTNERVDPVMMGHVETGYGAWDGSVIEKAHVRISWPTGLKLYTRQTNELPQPSRRTEAGWNVIELNGKDVQPLLLPNGAPMRFRVGRAGEVTAFESWSELADLMAPLYRKASVVPKSGPLRDELEKIRSTGKTDKERAELALQLVEERIRYVALSMGTGGYVPASAETTWSRRFGDCKAKSSLLIALLNELGIEAEPVLVHSIIGDAIPQRLPMVSYFNHVIVRARIAGKTYWLDGTRTGDTQLERVPVANFEWGLPLVADAKLVPIVPEPLAAPVVRTAISIDARAGIFSPAPFKIEQTITGDTARQLHIFYSSLTPAQTDQVMREYWRKHYDYVEVASSTQQFDKALSEFRWGMVGTATLDWDDGWLFVPGSTIAYEPNFDRSPGPNREAPFEIAYPNWEKTVVTLKLPPKFAATQKEPPRPVHEKLAGVEYRRTVHMDASGLRLEAEERALASEVPYKEAIDAKGRLKALWDEDVYVRIPNGYRASDADVAGLALKKPASAKEFVWRGNVYLGSGKLDEAIADFTKAHELDAKNEWAVANRAIARVWKRDFAEAEKDLTAAETRDPHNPVVLRARGLLAEFDGDPKKAEEFFTKSLAREPGDSFALARRAMALSSQGKHEEAISDLTSVLAREPSSASALEARASAYHSLKLADKALADTEAALKAGSDSATLRLLRANILRGLERYELAVGEAEFLIKEHPKSAFALVAAAKILSAGGQRDKAMQAFDRALAVEPEAYVYINRSQVRPSSDHEGRLADLDAALKVEPDQPQALALKASLLMKRSDYQGAIQLFDRALLSKPDDPLDLRRARAVAAFKSGQIADAEKAFAQVRAESTKAVDFNNLCWDKVTAGILLESALEDCREALRLRPGTASYLDSLGLALLRLGRLDEAVETYDKAIAKARLAPSFMGRAVAHVRKGDFTRARSDRAEALKLDLNIEAEFADYGVEFGADEQSALSK